MPNAICPPAHAGMRTPSLISRRTALRRGMNGSFAARPTLPRFGNASQGKERYEPDEDGKDDHSLINPGRCKVAGGNYRRHHRNDVRHVIQCEIGVEIAAPRSSSVVISPLRGCILITPTARNIAKIKAPPMNSAVRWSCCERKGTAARTRTARYRMMYARTHPPDNPQRAVKYRPRSMKGHRQGNK